MIFIRGENLTDSIVFHYAKSFWKIKKFTFAKKLTFNRYCKRNVLEYSTRRLHQDTY